jgi:hypothetical protein
MNGRCVSLIGSGVQTLIFSDAFCIEIKAKEIHGKQTTKNIQNTKIRFLCGFKKLLKAVGFVARCSSID